VKVVSLEPELRKDCLANNISMGRYALYEKASNSGVKVSLQQARNQPVSDLVKFIEEVDKDPANAQAIRKGLISNTPPVNMPEGRIANQDNNRPEKSSAITAFKMKDNSAAPNPATVKTPDGNKSGEKSPISVNRPTSVSSPKRIPAHTDSNDIG
jgi:soluble lytic murein transglycosylase-like protein